MASDGGNQWDDEPRIELRGDPAYRQRGVDYGAEPYLEEEVPQQTAPVRRFGPLRFALVGVALLVFAGLIFYAYSWGSGDPDPEELPVIAAPAGVEKEPPSNPGGMEVPYQDSMVLNPQAAQQGDDIERLLPPPEEPQPREPAATQPQPAETGGEPTAAAPAEEEAAEPETAAPEVTEETVVPETPTPDMQEPGAAAEQEAEPEAPQAEPAETETAEPEPAPAEEEAAPAEPEAPAAAATSGSFIIQLASTSNRDAVEGEWANMQRRHPEQLGNLQLHVEQADLGERGTFYRLQAGPLSSQEAADSLCAALQAQQQDCLVRAR